jgi:hypothetical protein
MLKKQAGNVIDVWAAGKKWTDCHSALEFHAKKVPIHRMSMIL